MSAQPTPGVSHTHVFPVPPSMTPADAWDELTIMGHYVVPIPDDVLPQCQWARLTCDGWECLGIDAAITELSKVDSPEDPPLP